MATLNISDEFDLSGYGHAVDLSKLPPKGVEYLLRYGFNKSMQDVVAGTRKSVADAYAARGSADGAKTWEGMCEAVGLDVNSSVDAVTTAAVEAARKSRFDDIQQGSVGTRTGGPRLSPEDKIRQDVIGFFAKLIADRKKLALPKGRDELAAFRAKVYNANATKIEAEIKRRVAALTKVDDLNLDL